MPYDEGSKEFGNTWVVKSNEISLSTAIYAAGDLMGGLLTFPDVIQSDRGGGAVVGVELIDTSTVLAQIDLALFDKALSTGSKTSATGDNAAVTLADTDLANALAVINLSTGNIRQLYDNQIHYAANISYPFYLIDGRAIRGVLIAHATPTYATGNSMFVKLSISRDA